jgi:hypothetical protein
MVQSNIRLRIIRAVFGELSHRYKAASASLAVSSTDKDRTRKVCYGEDILAHLEPAVNPPSGLKKAQTSFKILFEETEFSLTKSEVIKREGLPVCTKDGRHAGNWEVAGYEGMFRGVNIRKYYYFLNNRFVFGEIRLGKESNGFNRDASDTGYQSIFRIAHLKLCESIVLRYQITIPGISDGFSITDPAGSTIVFCSDGQYTWVRFLQAGSSEVKKAIDTLFPGD